MSKRRGIFGFPFFGPAVARMKAQGDAKGLVDALQHGDNRAKVEAREALLSLGCAAVPALLDLLRRGDVAARQAAVSLLEHCKEAHSTAALCEALKDEDGYVRLMAVRALKANADASAVAPLVRIAQDPKASEHVQTVLRSVLYHAAETVSTEDLRLAAQLNDSYVLIFAQVETSCTFQTYNVSSEEADFTQIKQLARQELIRRGLDA